jgi:hypothetical protein
MENISEEQRIKDIFKGSTYGWLISAILIVIFSKILNYSLGGSTFLILAVLIGVGILGGLLAFVLGKKYFAIGIFSSTTIPAIAYYMFLSIPLIIK